jgi:hypothetical protein
LAESEKKSLDNASITPSITAIHSFEKNITAEQGIKSADEKMDIENTATDL